MAVLTSKHITDRKKEQFSGNRITTLINMICRKIFTRLIASQINPNVGVKLISVIKTLNVT